MGLILDWICARLQRLAGPRQPASVTAATLIEEQTSRANRTFRLVAFVSLLCFVAGPCTHNDRAHCNQRLYFWVSVLTCMRRSVVTPLLIFRDRVHHAADLVSARVPTRLRG
jgi:hypothetical protein